MASRQADLARARAHLASSQSEVEAQRRQRAVLDSQELLLRADLAAKKASLTLAQTNLGYTRIAAPENGVVSERKVRAGQMVNPGTQVISLVQKDTWVDANYKETQLRYMRIGDHAEIRVDAGFSNDLVGADRADAVNVTERERDFLLRRDFYTEETRHVRRREELKVND